MKSMLTSSDIERVAGQLAARASLTDDEAMRVLKVLHVEMLIENSAALERTLSDNAAARALNIDESTRRELLHAASTAGFDLSNLRIGIRPKGDFHVNIRV